MLIFYFGYLQCINLELSEVNGEAGIHKHHCQSHEHLKSTGLKLSSVCMKPTVQTLNSHLKWHLQLRGKNTYRNYSIWANSPFPERPYWVTWNFISDKGEGKPAKSSLKQPRSLGQVQDLGCDNKKGCYVATDEKQERVWLTAALK